MVVQLDAHQTGDQEVRGSILAGSRNILSWRLIMNIFYGHSLPYCLSGSVGCMSDWWSGGGRFDLRWVQQHSFLEIDHEILSTVIPSLLLIQDGQLSVSGERISTFTG